jgi:hypothetical protein
MKSLLINLIKAFIWGVVCIFAIPLSCACAANPLEAPVSKQVPISKPVMSSPLDTKERVNLKHLFPPKRHHHLRLSTDRQGLT